MQKLGLFLSFLLVVFSSISQEYSTMTIKELESLKAEAVKNENYKEASKIKQIILLKEEISQAVAEEEYLKADSLQKVIKNIEENKPISEKTEDKSNNTQISTTKKNSNFDEEKYKQTVNLRGHTPPRPGKAVVYLVRVSAVAYAVAFQYFHNDEFIGQSKGVSYIRYEVDPGEHLFWASSENKSFITINAEAGKTYFIYVDVLMGAWKATVKLSGVYPNQEKRIKRAVEVINKHDPYRMPEEKKKKIIEKLNNRNFIQNILNKYNTTWKQTNNYHHLKKNDNIDEKYL